MKNEVRHGTLGNPTTGAQAIRRAVEIVRTVAQLQRSGASLSRIARAVGLSTSTTFRILRSLTEERLLTASPDVLALFAGNAFPQSPPKYIRAVLWQYWFTSMAEKRTTGLWWKRQLLGLYAPALTLKPDGGFDVVQWPEPLPPHE